jgi:hypothetical protein
MFDLRNKHFDPGYRCNGICELVFSEYLLWTTYSSSKQTILRDACSLSDAYDQDSFREIKIQVLILLRNGFYYTEEGSVK